MTHATPEPGPISSQPPPTATRERGLPKRLRGLRDAQDAVSPQAASRARPEREAKALQLAVICARLAAENKAKDVLLLDLRPAVAIVDFFVIASATSRRQASAVAYEIDAEMKKRGESKLGMEGLEEGRWILIDYGDFVVHILSEEARAYYGLEEIWGDCGRLDWQALSSASTSGA